MTAVKERAIQLIKNVPEDKMDYLITIIENLSNGTTEEKAEKNRYSLDELEKYIKPLNIDDDYKKELYTALEEKYDGIS